VNAATLLKEARRLRSRNGEPAPFSHDPVEFARDVGLSDLDQWQEDLLRSEAARVLLNCCRQSGKSTMAAILALHQALTDPGSLVLILAPAERQAKELFSKVSEAYRAFGHVVPAESYRKLGMELANGSRIEALPGSERTVRGFSGVDLLIVDEAARVDDALYYAVRPMLAVSGGRLMMLSTPYGKRGVFYEEWTGGEAGERYEVPASQCPRIPPAFLATERRSMPEWWYAQEYGCEFRETEDQLFTHEMIEGARDDALEEYRFEGDEDLWNTA
jgi:Terminase large subunit, T4likevirus-type, N-terminal